MRKYAYRDHQGSDKSRYLEFRREATEYPLAFMMNIDDRYWNEILSGEVRKLSLGMNHARRGKFGNIRQSWQSGI